MSASHIAIVGMAGRFPGAATVEALWRNLVGSVDAIRPIEGPHRPGIVPVVATMEHVDRFDAAFFGIAPAYAEIMDPQHRVFLEVGWAALEDAGYDASRYPGAIGVYAGATANSYFAINLASNADVLQRFTSVELNTANANDFLTTRLSYAAGLTGPSHAVQCACSTSLVAVCQACQALLDGQCDMAIAGGVSVNVMHLDGYRHIEGGMFSPDGRCRPFSAAASGTVFGNGAAAVVLKPLADALHDRDHIQGVIIGWAVNNDGRRKVGYLAPGVDGQSRVIAEALANADVTPDSIGLVEAHGTATPVGDPIEVRALTTAYAGTERRQFCSLGSVKSNVGHLDAAAGVTGLIKATLALSHRCLPGTVEVVPSHPDIDFSETPFYVHADARPWESVVPRRAGVSAFGVGGTNAHVIVEEAPSVAPPGAAATTTPARGWNLLTLSARSAAALDEMSRQLAGWLRDHPAASLADVAYTLQVGRRRFRFRRAVLCRDVADAIGQLATTGYVEARVEDSKPVGLFFGAAHDAPIDVDRLRRENPEMSPAIEACEASAREARGAAAAFDDRIGQTFVAQYAAARALVERGVTVGAFHGTGVGRITGSVFGDAVPLAAARRACHETAPAAAADEDDAPSDAERWAAAHDAILVRFDAAQSRAIAPATVSAAALYDGAPAVILRIIGDLWEAGAEIDWTRHHHGEPRGRVSLPTYPFESQRYWIDAPSQSPSLSPSLSPATSAEGPPSQPPAPRRPAAKRPPLAVRYAPARTQTEQVILTHWSAALGIDRIGIDDNFFDLGGDSLLAVRVAEALARAFGGPLPASAFYEGVTIRLLAEIIDTEVTGDPHARQLTGRIES